MYQKYIQIYLCQKNEVLQNISYDNYIPIGFIFFTWEKWSPMETILGILFHNKNSMTILCFI